MPPCPNNFPPCPPRHCTIPAPEAGYSPSPVVEPVTVGQEINYTCAGTFATVEGTGSNTHTIRCGNDTNFPSGWPKCKVCTIKYRAVNLVR